jgi:hypothetical protein
VEQELAIDPAAERAPEIDLVLAEVELVRVAAEREPVLVLVELELGLAAVELEHVLVAAGLAQGHPRVQPAVVPTTKSVTAAHRRDLVPLLAVEDLAVAAAETTREPVATEAAIAWEVADTVAVEEAVVVAVAAVVVVAADGDEHSMRKNQ